AARVAAASGDLAAPGDVQRLIGRVAAAGRTPVVLAAQQDQVAAYWRAVQVMKLVTRQYERSLVDAPDATWSLRINVWMAVP
ncbi:MAG: hypothetical protein HOY71_31450, partial [Nonomuraea sp.]|nr:hypothetical protein [Nonomuraea sp.]